MCQLPQSVAVCHPPPESFLNQLSGTGRWLGGPEETREGVGLRALGSRKGRGMNRTLGGGPGPSPPACLAQLSLPLRPQPTPSLPRHPTTVSSPAPVAWPRAPGQAPPTCLGVHPTETRRQGEGPGTVRDPGSQPFLYVHSVDGDPHFIIQVPEKDDAICFNIDEEPGTVLRLIQDPVTGGDCRLGPGSIPGRAWSP